MGMGGMMGGGGGGGGGGAGRVDFPAHITTAHSNWLSGNVTSSVVHLMNAAFGNSPWIGQNAYNPDAPLTSSDAAITAYETLVSTLSSGTALDDLVNDLLGNERIEDDADAFADQLDDQLAATVYPRFEAGMRDINAVMSSAFVIGRALIEEGRNREVAKYLSGLRYQAFGRDALSLIGLRLNLLSIRLQTQRELTATTIESNRIKIVALKEQADTDMDIDDRDAKWDLSAYQYGAEVMAAPGGGIGVQKEKSMLQSVLGGALSGAGAGGSMGGPWGALIGGVGGAGMGALEHA
jgi:hypothetical protein